VPAHFELASADRLRIVVDDAGATYPVVIDPLLTETADAQLESNQGTSEFGAVAGAGDVNGDGYADVIVGASRYDNGQTDEGAAFLFRGSASGIASANPSSPGVQMLESNLQDGVRGYSVAGAGDVNGDGYSDVIVGAPYYNSGQGVFEGAAFVFLGSASGLTTTSPGLGTAQLEGNQASGQFGKSVAGAGDVNGDGYADVIVGTDSYNAGLSFEGAAFVFHGGISGIANGNPSTADAQLESNQSDVSY